MTDIDKIKIKDFIHEPTLCTIEKSDLNYNNIMNIFKHHNKGIIFVVIKKDFYGIITAGDIRETLDLYKGNISNVDIKVNVSPIYVSSEESASTALHIMRTNDIVILPVIDEKKLKGYVTLQDISVLFSPERLYITETKEYIDTNYQKHIHRYIFSSLFIENGRVLDCACGSGYGSKIISKKADWVYGIDKSEESITFAKKNNSANNILYKCLPLQDTSFGQESLQAIVSLETLEHISKSDMIEFLKKSATWLLPKGCFIGSSPMLRYRDNKPYITNPYHINELPKDELLSTIKECFPNFSIYFFHQNIKSFNNLLDENTGFCIFVARKL